jgi:hypothetical protein
VKCGNFVEGRSRACDGDIGCESGNNGIAGSESDLVPFPSIWGHFAGGPGTSSDDVKFLDGKLKELLAS